jgi:hypothetical protein
MWRKIATVANSRRMADYRRSSGSTLTTIGLSEVEATLYTALVSAPRSTVTDLAQRCGMTVHQTGRAMGRLVTDGLVGRLPGRRPRYLAVAPDVVLGAVISTRESELTAAKAAVHALAERYREASQFVHPAAAVEVVTGAEGIGLRVEQIHASAQKQIRGFDRAPYVRPPGHDGRLEYRRLRDGIEYRVIYDQQAVAWPGRMEQDIIPSCAAGERARVAPTLPTKLLMADESLALIPVVSGQHVMDVAYVIHASALLDALARLFEDEWAAATPLDVRPARIRRQKPDSQPPAAADRPEPPDENTATLLALLASGQTDAGIARSLGWSLRTTQRRVRELMATLHATTRFQAGIAARERGWV